jgi:putative endopeptidase
MYKLKTPIIFILFAFIMITGCMKKDKAINTAINPKDMDTTVQPGTDFYKYANGGWMKNNPIPADYSRFGQFDILQEQNNKMVKELVTDIASKENKTGSDGQLISDFYNSGMDSATIEKLGLQPLLPELKKIDDLKSLSDVQNEVAYLHTVGINPLFDIYGEQDSKNSKMFITHLDQGGLGLADRDYYFDNSPRGKEIRSEYLKHITKMFELSGADKAGNGKSAQTVIDIETKLAKVSITRLEKRNPNNVYHKMSLKELETLSPEFKWDAYFKNVGLPVPGDINAMEPTFFAGISTLFKEVPLNDWKVYLKWNLINETANYLPSAFVNQNFEFYGKVLSGTQKIKPRWKRVLSTTNEALGMALGKIYSEKYFPPQAKERMIKLVQNLRLSLGDRIKQLQWMGDSTKKKALEKLQAINVKIGYPDEWRNYTGLVIKPKSYLDNALNSNKFNFEFMLSKLNKPVNPKDWQMTPQTVNAYYNPTMNEICFPAGILQPPFFYKDADDAVNYGGIGVVIGHEITHGFDDEGRLYDKVGNLNEWWTKEDETKFNEKSKILADQFSSFVVLDTLHANGKLTLGENLADLGGLNISYYALQKELKDSPAPGKIDGFTPEQRFFLAFAHLWAQNIRDQEIQRRTKEDVHSLGNYRVNGPLPNLPEFYAAFGIKPGDKMYKTEKYRAVIW